MPADEYPSGTVENLLHSPAVTPATHAALEPRLAWNQPYQPRYFTELEIQDLRSVCARLLPSGDIDLAARIDERLATGQTDGWRYDALPPDGEAYRQGLRQLGDSFPYLDSSQQDALLQQLPPRLLEEWLAEMAEIAYSHPAGYDDIGYAGFADAPGWTKIGLDERESREPELGQPYTSTNFPPPLPRYEPQQPPMRRFSPDEVVDAVIVGTGAGGAPILARLAAAGLKVVALEAGCQWDPARDFATDERAQADLFWNHERLSAGENPLAFGRNNSGTGVGGSTLHFTAYTPRPQPDDFRLHSDFGVGADWPLSYWDLEPYFDELEHLLGISGPNPYPWGPPRRRGYPLPPLPLNGAAQLMQRGCDAIGLRHSPAANAALSAPYFQQGIGLRPACANRGFCQAGCTLGAKASMDVTFIPLAIHHGAEIRPECFVTHLEIGTAGSITAVVYSHEGREHRQLCRNVFLCAGAIETPRLLLLNGLSNANGQVGRHFMAHPGLQLWAEFPEMVRPFKGIPGGLISEDMHRPPDADFAGGYLLQSIGVMPTTYASQLARGPGSAGAWGEKFRQRMRAYNHVAGINVLGECLPYEQNYLELSTELDDFGLPKPRIHFTAGENEHRLMDHASSTMESIWTAAGAQNAWSFERYAHIMGTCRMGHSSKNSVVDPACRSHEVSNLYICDNSVFPSAMAVNPSLAIMALALRTADHFLSGR